MLKQFSIKLSRCLVVLGLLCVLGETPLRIYGHVKWIESRHVDTSQSDFLTLFDLAFGQNPILIFPLDSLLDFFALLVPDLFQEIPIIIGRVSIPFIGRGLGGCGS